MTHDFDEPLNEEPDGTYITSVQMKFFLNNKDGVALYQERSEIFEEYYDICRVYNLVSDIMKESPDAAIMYWDEDIEAVSMAFPAHGKVSRALGRIKPHCVENKDEEDNDPWGLMEDSPWSE